MFDLISFNSYRRNYSFLHCRMKVIPACFCYTFYTLNIGAERNQIVQQAGDKSSIACDVIADVYNQFFLNVNVYT